MQESPGAADGEGSTNSIHPPRVCCGYSSPERYHHSLSVPPSSVVSGGHQRRCRFLLMLFVPNKDNTRSKSLAKEVMLRRPEVWVSLWLLGLGQVEGASRGLKQQEKRDEKRILTAQKRERGEILPYPDEEEKLFSHSTESMLTGSKTTSINKTRSVFTEVFSRIG